MSIKEPRNDDKARATFQKEMDETMTMFGDDGEGHEAEWLNSTEWVELEDMR